MASGEQDGRLALPDLPSDLPAIYNKRIQGHLATSQKRWRQVRPLLGALVVARDSGLKRDQLHGIMDLFKELRPSETDDLLGACLQYLEGTMPTGPFRVYHESFREFLQRSANFSVYPAEAHQAIADFFLEIYGSDWLACEDKYALRHTLVHLLEAVAATTRPEDKLAHARIQKKVVSLREDEGYKVARMRRLSRGELAPAVESFVSQIALDFVGRQWVLERVNDWLGSSESRYFLIVGRSGMGKTALAARLWQISRGLVGIDELRFPQLTPGYLTYAYLAQAMDPISLALVEFLEGLSRMLVYRYEDYARLYLDQVRQHLAPAEDQPDFARALDLLKTRSNGILKGLKREARVMSAVIKESIAGDPAGTVEIGHILDQFEESKGAVVRELVSQFHDVQQAADALLDPLRQICLDQPDRRLVILLDGLGGLARTSDSVHLNLLSLLDRLPEQVRFILLSRPQPELVNTLRPPQVDLDQETAAGKDDIFAYVLERLSSLPEQERRSIAEQVARRSGGNFARARGELNALGKGE
jgi:hypothetical protein